MKISAVLDRKGFRALLAECSRSSRATAKRDRMLFYLMGKTGLRISEALALRRVDVSVFGPSPFLRTHTLKKRGRPAELIALDSSTARALQRYLRSTPPCPHERPIFTIGRRNAGRLFKRYARRAGLSPDVRLHSLRHFRGTELYRASKDLEFVRRQLRHSDTRSTQVYVHFSPERLRQYLEDCDEGDRA